MPGPAAAGIPGLLAGYVLKTTAVLILALLAAAAAKKRPAAFRHFILSSALIGLLLIPVLTLAPVGWHSRLLPAWMAAPAPAEAGSTTAAGILNAAEITASGSGHGLSVDGPAGGGRGSASSKALAADKTFGRTEAIKAAASARPSPFPSAGPPVPARDPRSGAVGLLLALLWATGAAALLARLSFGLAGAGRLTAEGTPLDAPAWRALLARFLALVSFRREVSLKSHPEVLVPLTCGWRRPTVLFPEGADAWSDDERSSALFHELSHVRRADFLVMLLVRASLALFWWNPLCWIVCREIQKEQELACDELVLRAGIRPSIYAATLLAFRRSAGFRWNPSAALLGMLGKSSFQDRLAAILKQKLTLMEVKMKTKIMLALALVLAVALIGTARPVSATGTAEGLAVMAETASPSPALVDIGAPTGGPAQAEQAVARETKQEKAKTAEKAEQAEKAKAAEKAAREKAVAKTVVIKPVTVAGKPIEVVITEGDQVKTIVIEKPLTITKGKGGDTLILTVDGKELEVLKGGPLRLEITGGELQVLKEGQTLKIGDGKVFSIVKKGDQEGQSVYFIGTNEPEIVIDKIKAAEEAEVAEAAGQVFVKIRGDQKEGETWVAAPVKTPRAVEVAPGRAAKADAWVAQGKPLAWKTVDDGMLEKVQALQEQVQAIKAKKMDITALEDSLEKLAAELKAKEKSLSELKIKVEKVKADEADARTGVRVYEKGQPAQAAKTQVMIGSDDKDKGTISLMFTGRDGEAGQLAFERALVTLKKDLPEGAKIVEQRYDAGNGTMTFKIALPEGGKADETLVRKLVDRVKEAIKTAK